MADPIPASAFTRTVGRSKPQAQREPIPASSHGPMAAITATHPGPGTTISTPCRIRRRMARPDPKIGLVIA